VCNYPYEVKTGTLMLAVMGCVFCTGVLTVLCEKIGFCIRRRKYNRLVSDAKNEFAEVLLETEKNDYENKISLRF
jgi:hypothetical protein